MIIWLVFAQFFCRVTWGLALAMCLTSSRLVTSGFFRVHLWVLMGINTFAALMIFSQRGPTADDRIQWMLPLTTAAAVLSYVGAVLWLYEAARMGKLALTGVAVLGLVAGIAGTPLASLDSVAGQLHALDVVAGGILLGAILAAMLLGHWYLNTPGMELAPLRRLLIVLLLAILLRALLSGIGLGLLAQEETIGTQFWIFLSLRWLAGILGVLVAAGLAWQTLKIPNTQSATGILYAGVIVAFIGELMSQLLSAAAVYPV